MPIVAGMCPKCHKALDIEIDDDAGAGKRLAVACDHCGGTSRFAPYRRGGEKAVSNAIGQHRTWDTVLFDPLYASLLRFRGELSHIIEFIIRPHVCND